MEETTSITRFMFEREVRLDRSGYDLLLSPSFYVSLESF